MKKICTIILGLFFFQASYSQIEISISDDQGDFGETVSFDVRVNGFTEVIAAQMSVNWNPDVMQYSSVTNISSTLPTFGLEDFGTPVQPSIEDGELTFIWSLGDASEFTLPSNHLLFTLVCTVSGDPCDNTDVFSSDTPRVIEFTDVNENVMSFSTNDGTLEIPGSGCESGGDGEVDFVVGNKTVMIGESFCVPITVDDFEEVSLFQLPVRWDSDKLNYTGIQNEILVDAIAVGNAGLGTLRYLWQDATLEAPVTLPNGSKLFDICFTSNGPSGSSTSICVEDILDISPTFSVSILDPDEVELDYTVDCGTITTQGGSNDITFYFDDIEMELGTNVCIPIKVRNFDNIQTFQYAIDFDENVLSYTGTNNLNSDLQPSIGGAFHLIGQDNLRVSWLDNSGIGVDLDNDVIAFEVCFDVMGDCDLTTEVEFTDNINGGVEITDATNDVLPYVLDPGTVNIVCSCAISLTGSGNIPVSCNGGSDGSLTVMADGGNGNYTYSWSNSASGSTIMGLEEGMYTVSVSDGANCNTSFTYTITEPSAIAIQADVINETTNCNGEIMVTVTGGTATYDYSWSDNGGINSPTRTGLCKGDYSVTVTDANNCTKSMSYYVAPKPLQVVDFEVKNVSCNGGNDGSITLDIEGGCPAYTIDWPSGINPDALQAGSYTVTITDASTPPVSLSQMYTITQPTNPILVVINSITSADGGTANGAIDIFVNGGTSGYTFKWSPGGQITEDISGLSSGKYTVEVTDINNCVFTSEPICVGTSEIIFNATDSNDPAGAYNGFGVACNGDCNGSIDGELVAANGNVIYKLDGEEVTLPVVDLCAGTYNLTYEDEEGLTGSEVYMIFEADAIDASFTEVSECSNGEDGLATILASGGAVGLTFQWSATTQTGETVDNLPEGNVNVIITDINGCQFMIDTVLVSCEGPDECYSAIPVITPNADGANDVFVISCLKNQNNTLFVYDRFGRSVYKQVNYDNTWTGTDVSGEELPENGYMWVLELITDDGTRLIYKGTVTILRSTY